MEISGKQLDLFREDFNKAVESLEEQYGVTISLGHITYYEERFTAKLTVTNGTTAYDVERAAFDADVWKYGHLGLEQGMYKRIFTAKDGKRYAIKGFNTKARKYPIIVIDVRDGSEYRAGEGFIDYLEDIYYAD